METRNFSLAIVVNNRFGVLSRVTGLFSKRGYNIEKLYVDPVDENGHSRIRLSSMGDDNVQEQIVKQLQKLHDVKEVQLVSSF